jgi:hypothetical protein
MSNDGMNAIDAWRPSSQFREILNPFVKIDKVGYEGLEALQISALPALADTQTRARRFSHLFEKTEVRVPQFAMSLTECESERCCGHFMVSEYFVNNMCQVRRVKTFETAIRATQRTRRVPDVKVPKDSESLMGRYNPRWPLS